MQIYVSYMYITKKESLKSSLFYFYLELRYWLVDKLTTMALFSYSFILTFLYENFTPRQYPCIRQRVSAEHHQEQVRSLQTLL